MTNSWGDGIRPQIKAAALITMAAPLLGGCVEPWAQSLLFMAFGLLLLLSKPERKVPNLVWALCATLLVPVLFALLPDIGAPALWRKMAHEDLGIILPFTRSPQPLLTVEGGILLAFGVICALWWRSQILEQNDRWFLLRNYCWGVLLVAALSLASKYSKVPIPGWESPVGFGPFANRNQTANLLSLGALCMLACAHHALRVRRRAACFGWSAAMLVTLAALILDFSRAGILIFGLGATIWLLCSVLTSRRPQGRIMIAAGILLFLLGGFVLVGGDTFRRFQKSIEPDEGVTHDFRLKIYEDSVAIWREAPALGIGYGNFEGIFNFYRDKSAGFNRVRHADSDWVWAATEGGALTVVTLAALIVWGFSGLRPFRKPRDRTARLAALIALGLFLAHSIFDVSGHRLGTLLPALLMLGIVQSPEQRAHLETQQTRRIFSGAGLFFSLFGLVWFISLVARLPLPGSVAVVNALHEAKTSKDSRQTAWKHLTQALTTAPLNLELYMTRAAVAAEIGRPLDEVRRDFFIARNLESYSPEMALNEAYFWTVVDPPSAMPALGEVLSRAGNKWPLYMGHVVNVAGKSEETREWLRRTCSTRIDWRLIFLKHSTPEEFHDELTSLLDQDPTLSTIPPKESRLLFEAAAERDTDFLLSEIVTGNPKWMKQAWSSVAIALFAKGRTEEAVRMARDYVTPPSLPPRPVRVDLDELLEASTRRPRDPALAYGLYNVYANGERYDLALAALEKITPLPECPVYFYFLEFDALYRLQKWDEAWAVWQNYWKKKPATD